MQTQVSLSTTLQPPVPQSTMQLVLDQTSIRVTDGIQDYMIRLTSGDQCMRVNRLTYSNSIVPSGGVSTNNIAELVMVNRNTG